MSERIRYATLLYIAVNEFNIMQKNLYGHKRFNLEKGTFSKYVNGKIQVKNEITKDKFYSLAFSNDSKLSDETITINQDSIDIIYNSLKNNDFLLSKELIDKYEQKDFDGFVKILIDEAEESRKNKLTGNGFKTQNTDVDNSESTELLNMDFSKESFSNFVGRECVLNEITNKLNKYSYAIICGMGGMGKSKCAQKYAIDSSKNNIYNRIQLIYFENDLSTTLLNIKFEGHKKEYGTDKERLNANLRILKELDENSLLIIDNFDEKPRKEDYDILNELISYRIHILITSRNMNMGSEKFIIEIPPLSPDEQVELFSKNYAEVNDETKNSLKRILELIEGHTMLIEMIAKTMRDNCMTVDEMYQSLLDGDDDSVSEIRINKDNEYENDKLYSYISKLFDINNIDEAGRKLLVNLSLSGISGIRLRILKLYLLEVRNLEPVNSLIDRSWIIRESMKNPIFNRIHLHTAISKAVLKTLKPSLDDIRNYLESVIKICNINDIEVNQEDKHDMRTIIMNTSNMFIDKYLYKDIDFLARQAEILDNSNESSRALNISLKFYKKCIDLLLENNSHCDDIRLFNFYLKSGDIYTKLTDNINAYEQAVILFQKAIDGYSIIKDYEGLAVSYNKLGNIYRKSSKYENSKESFIKALEIINERHIDNSILKADILNNFGILFINIDEYDKSLSYYLDARKIREGLPESDEKTKLLAYSYQNIGTAHQKKKNYLEALLWHKKALDLRKKIFSENNFILADSLNMIGNDIIEAYKDNPKEADMKNAKEYLDKALKLRVTKLGNMHSSTAWSHQSLGTWYYYMNIYDEAIKNFDICLNIRTSILGNKHKYTGQALLWLGKTYAQISDKESAKKYLSDAACIFKGLGLNTDYEQTIKELEAL